MNRPPAFRTLSTGVRLVYRAADYRARFPRAALLTCGTCGRTWDDAHATAWTPAPAARCPFENLHKPGPRR